MKVIINECYGGFGTAGPRAAWEERNRWQKNVRTDPEAIEILRKYGSKACSAHYAELVIMTIPDAATDWEIDEYDGCESITYVLDGKIFHL